MESMVAKSCTPLASGSWPISAPLRRVAYPEMTSCGIEGAMATHGTVATMGASAWAWLTKPGAIPVPANTIVHNIKNADIPRARMILTNTMGPSKGPARVVQTGKIRVLV